MSTQDLTQIEKKLDRLADEISRLRAVVVDKYFDGDQELLSRLTKETKGQ